MIKTIFIFFEIFYWSTINKKIIIIWHGNETSVGNFGFHQSQWLRTSKNKKWGEKVQKKNIGFSKITKAWSSKPIKAKKDNSCLKEMVQQETIECHGSKTTPPIPLIPRLPENIANVQKPNKEEKTKNQISTFQ